MNKILIIDDDSTFCLMLNTFLSKKGFQTKTTFSGKEAIKVLKAEEFDIILTDYRLPDYTGLELIQHIRDSQKQAAVILMTSYADIRTAVKAIKMGAFEYIAKPINPDELLLTIKNAGDSLKKQQGPSKPEATSKKVPYITGISEEAIRIKEYIMLVAPTDMSVIIQGESGTGKEYVSRMIHENSSRRDKPFVALDCGALSKDLAGSELFGHVKGAFTGATHDKQGQFEWANGGTIFLDEVGNLSYDIQIKLLRAIQERTIRKTGSNHDVPIDVRIITATNEDLIEAVKNGHFREDLYHRLNEFKISVNPLRKRKKDIPLFARYFLESANAELGKSIEGYNNDVMEVFMRYPWPGNLREFKNVVKRAVLLAKKDSIDMSCLPTEIIYHEVVTSATPAPAQTHPQTVSVPPTTDLKAFTEKSEREIILSTLEQVRFNKSQAARLLNIDRKTLYNKLRLYGIDI
jgi:two-component system response regulator HydG